ncbi:hypothetical protein BDW74DRAFT_152712 [Aspergillus multicolor]|uniref:uncharacterized protein n=1 Tax=Aspergillus multicolor TaxID=41759 RepID=UPI003CCD07E9
MATKLILPLLCFLVFYTIFYTFEINGASKLVKACIATGKLPASDAALRQIYTGIAPLDRLLTILVVFFWPLTDGSNLSLLVHGIGFSGAFGSIWVLVTLESWRKGNAWKLVAFPMVFGLVAQAMTIAFAAPLYFAIQLFTSSTAIKPTAENIRVPRAVLNAIPLAFVVGYLVPTNLMLIPVSEIVTTDLKQILVSLWQPWPAYISILLTLAYLAFSPSITNDRTVEGSRATLRSLRWVYAFAFANTALTHIISWIIPLATVAVPLIFKKEFLQPLHPLVVFDVPKPWGAPVIVENVGAGVHAFLRWDYIISSTATLVWALSLYRAAHRVVYGRIQSGCVDLLVKVAVLVTLTGPVGAAVELLWERDELVLSNTGGSRRTAAAEKKVV